VKGSKRLLGPQLLWLALVAASLPWIAPKVASGQELFRLYGWHGHLRASGSFENEDVEGAQALTSERLFFREEVALRTNGHLIDPKLAGFSLGGQVSLVQDELDTTTEGKSTTQTGNGLLYGYDGNLALVQGLPYSLDLFASRSETNVRRTFVGRTLGNSERFGATIHARRFPLQSIATFQQQSSEQRQRLGTTQLQQDETRRTFTYRGRRRGRTSDIDVDYRFDDVADRVRKAGNFQLHLGGVSHIWRAPSELDRALFSNVRIFARQGETDSTSITGNESLTWQLTRNVWSSSNYNFSRFNSNGSKVMTHRGSAGLRHQWYKSLLSSLHAESTFIDFDQGQELDYGGGAGWSYTKHILWDGRLSASLSSSYLLTDRNVPPGLVGVFEESHSFSDTTPVVLENLDVVATSIVVTDQSQTVVFAEGIDYFVERLGRRTELRRNPFGDIDEGDSILVSYDFEVGGPFRIGSRPLSFSSTVDFGWVRFFYTGERLRQDVFKGEAAVTLGSIDSDSMGVELRRRGELLELVALNEYRRYRSVDLDFRSLTFTQTASLSFSRRLAVQLLATEAFHDFSQPDRSRDFFTGRVSVNWHPIPDLVARGFTGFRYQKETGIPLDALLETGLDVRYTMGQITVALFYEFDKHELGGGTRSGNFARLETIRSF